MITNRSFQLVMINLLFFFKLFSSEYIHYTFYILFQILETVVSSPFIAQELSLLKKAFHSERDERMKLQANEMAKVLSSLAPIDVPKTKDDRLNQLQKELLRTKRVIKFQLFLLSS